MDAETKKIRVQNIADQQEVSPTHSYNDLDGKKRVDCLYGDKKNFKSFDQPKSSFSCLMIFLTIFFGFVGGGIALFLFSSHIQVRIPFLGSFDLSKIYPARELQIVTEKKVTVTNDLELSELAKKIKPLVFRIYEEKNSLKDSKTLDKIYLEDEAVAVASALTSDGWLITSDDLDTKRSYVVFGKDDKTYFAENIFINHSAGISFLKIAATNLSVFDFVTKSKDVSLGQEVAFFNKKGEFFTDFISHKNFGSLVQSADYFTRGINLAGDYSQKDTLSSMIFNLDGKAVGLITNGKIIPSWQLNRYVLNFLEKGKLLQDYYGFRYLGLDELDIGGDSSLPRSGTGALVYGRPDKDSPSQKGGLLENDLITKVDDVPLLNEYDLTDLLQEKTPGDVLKLTVLRRGEEKEIKFVVRSAK